MSQIEQKTLTGNVILEDRTYRFEAVVFRRVVRGAFGHIGATPWQFGNHSSLDVLPAVSDRLQGHLENEILQLANRDMPKEVPQELKVTSKEDNMNNTETVVGIALEEKIGDGAYADVWRASDNRLGRKVAVKVLRPSSSYFTDAMNHARALARAQHPNVVVIHSLEKVRVPDTGEIVDGAIMELIDGPTLQEKLNSSDLFDLEDIFALAEGLINGLEHIHIVGMVHNDLHPGNVLIKGREIKIIDILYTDSLLRLTTGTKADKIRRDMRDLTTMLVDIARRSKLSDSIRKSFGYAMLDSTMTFDAVRNALQTLKQPDLTTTVAPSVIVPVSNTKLHQLKDALEQDRHNAKKLLADYFSAFTQKLAKHSIDIEDNTISIEDRVWTAFDGMSSCRDEFVDMILYICNHSRGISNYKKEIIELLQQVAVYSDYERSGIRYSHQWWNDNYKLFTHELFLYLTASLIHSKEYQLIYELTCEVYYFSNRRQGRESANFVAFREYAPSLEARNKNAQTRWAMPDGTLFKDRAKLELFPLESLMQADFILFLISLLQQQPQQQPCRLWWPVTLIYATYSHSFPFEIFRQAALRRYFDEIKVLFDVQSTAELMNRYMQAITIHQFENGLVRIAPSEFISIPALANLQQLGTR